MPAADGASRRRIVDADEGPRADTTLEKLASLRPAFREGGTVTAGNASTLNDGAACLVLASEEWAETLGARAARRGSSRSGSPASTPPTWGSAPCRRSQRALEAAGLELGEIDLIEINEAFAAQVLACARELGIDEERLNVNGGAIALGHPLGCSGARLMTTLVWELRRRGARYGIATLCVGVGQGVATIVENLDARGRLSVARASLARCRPGARQRRRRDLAHRRGDDLAPRRRPLRGDGAFEVIRLYGGRPFALDDHLDRLERSAAAIELEVDRAALEREIAAAARALRRRRRRRCGSIVTRGGRRLLLTEPLPERPARRSRSRP